MLVIKTGMQSEYSVAKRYADPSVLVLTGEYTATTLETAVPQNCAGIISFGLCGELAGDTIGQAFIYDTVDTPDGTFVCDVAWRLRLFHVTHYYEAHCWSSGQFNTANTITERAALYAQTGCRLIDDETYAVAQFAKQRSIPFIGLRVVSDGAEDNLPPAVLDALNPNGTDNIAAVLHSLIDDPLQLPALIKTAGEFDFAIRELNRAIIDAGPLLQAP